MINIYIYIYDVSVFSTVSKNRRLNYQIRRIFSYKKYILHYLSQSSPRISRGPQPNLTSSQVHFMPMSWPTEQQSVPHRFFSDQSFQRLHGIHLFQSRGCIDINGESINGTTSWPPRELVKLTEEILTTYSFLLHRTTISKNFAKSFLRHYQI